MAADLADFPEWKCPYCGKFLTNDAYNHAIEEFRVKAEHSSNMNYMKKIDGCKN
jgi:hypothetical protein